MGDTCKYFFCLFITQYFTNSNQRYLCLCPDEAEDFVDYLISVERLDDAAVLLGKIVNDNDFVSKKGKSNHTLWHELCKLISKNPKKISSLNVDAVSFYIQTKNNKRSATFILQNTKRVIILLWQYMMLNFKLYKIGQTFDHDIDFIDYPMSVNQR